MSPETAYRKEINGLLLQISDLEERRRRSEAGIVSALINHTTPSDEDAEFFNAYTEKIHALREEVRRKQVSLYAKNLQKMLPKKRKSPLSLLKRLFPKAVKKSGSLTPSDSDDLPSGTAIGG